MLVIFSFVLIQTCFLLEKFNFKVKFDSVDYHSLIISYIDFLYDDHIFNNIGFIIYEVDFIVSSFALFKFI